MKTLLLAMLLLGTCCTTSARPIGAKTETYSRDGVLKHLLIQANEKEEAQSAIESQESKMKTKKPINPTRLYDKAKISILNRKKEFHTKNENELSNIMYGGKAKVSTGYLFNRKKYKAIEAHTTPLSDFEYVFDLPPKKKQY
ncbi:uncharacterized protein FA14DRAFT_158151 [Meira miltonrushii]|uniref:Lipoprotein n=1 Tax=Meira miltonrushii TaxID=1280837 RepID=A0A316V3T8_9BASI|nr:uncharacterized protein FA14DRAFT_158151 [Meira miltonrushii]PWN32219.1 hypothetical protein FA14DRAFT_158151 [Meira miltonrushii]